jgi:hypothetical protein
MTSSHADPDTTWRWRLPGDLGTLGISAAALFWTIWSLGELYYEAWGLPFATVIRYLIPSFASLAAGVLLVRWPQLGAVLVLIAGAWFTTWWTQLQLGRTGGSLLKTLLLLFPASGVFVVTALCFFVEARRRRRLRKLNHWPRAQFWRRHLRLLVAIGPALISAMVISGAQLPRVLTRFDDGDRSARRIDSAHGALVWAPAGPGWNWKQPWGGYPSWDALALYGRAPIGIEPKAKLRQAGVDHATAADMLETGLCRYLSADGSQLLDTPPSIWRMPSAAEIVTSLVHDGASARCAWNGVVSTRAQCEQEPDKETPLWAPDQYPIYFWSSDQHDDSSALYVSYNGWVHAQPKHWGNPRHGYRCVRTP